jgi:hypothetical protein
MDIHIHILIGIELFDNFLYSRFHSNTKYLRMISKNITELKCI